MDQEVQTQQGILGNPVEIVVYVKEDLGEEQQRGVVAALEKTAGLIGLEFCPLRKHLVVAKYNREILSSQDVLKGFRGLDLDARLIGPI